MEKCKRRGDDNEIGNQKKRGEEDLLEGDNEKQKKAKKQIYVQVTQGSKPADNITKEKDHIIDLEAHPSSAPTAVVNEVDKGKSVLIGNENPLYFCVPSVNMDEDNEVDEAEDVREDNEKPPTLASEAEDTIENFDFIDITQRNSGEEAILIGFVVP